MATANTPAVHQALEVIFDKAPIVQAGATKVVLEKEVSPSEFRDLAQLSGYLHNHPTITRSGAGVSVVFTA